MYVFAIFLLLSVLYLFVIRPSKAEMEPALRTNYAHRGLHDAEIPENSLAAFRKAVSNGVGIELDLQLSKDGEVMVFHDENLFRMTGLDRNLRDLTKDELQGLLLNGTEERIPTFREVLQLIDGQVPLLIELKGRTTDTSLCEKADAILQEYQGAFCVESFNPMLLRWFEVHRPHIIRGMLYTTARTEKGVSLLHILLNSMVLHVLAKPHFIAHHQKLAHWYPLVLCEKLFRAPCFVWTVRDKASFGYWISRKKHCIFEQI